MVGFFNFWGAFLLLLISFLLLAAPFFYSSPSFVLSFYSFSKKKQNQERTYLRWNVICPFFFSPFLKPHLQPLTHQPNTYTYTYDNKSITINKKQDNTCATNDPGDYVDDTPQQSQSTTGCPSGKDSCPSDPGADAISNYMDYSSDAWYVSLSTLSLFLVFCSFLLSCVVCFFGWLVVCLFVWSRSRVFDSVLIDPFWGGFFSLSIHLFVLLPCFVSCMT